MRMMYSAGFYEPTNNGFFIFFHFVVSSALLSTGICLARAPKGKGKYPTVKKRAESAMEKNGWVKSCSFLVWLLEKSGKKKKNDKAFWNHLALICWAGGGERYWRRKKVEKHQGKKGI